VHLCCVSGVLKASRKVEVHFVDFGNREVVECEELRDMPAMFLTDLPVHAVACSLYGVDQTSTGSVSLWSPADVDAFSDLVYDQLLEVYFTSEQNADGHHCVHLLRDQENINRTFLRSIQRLSPGYQSPIVDPVGAGGDASATRKPSAASSGGLGTKLAQTTVPATSMSAESSLPARGGGVPAQESGAVGGSYKYEAYRPGEELHCVAAYVVSPAQFFVHKSTATAGLDSLLSDLTAAYNVTPRSASALSLGVGEPCAALYSEDSRWYRARLLDITPVGQRLRSVEFVDYGNTETVDEGSVHPLRSEFFTLPVQAICCQLAGVVPALGSEWSDDAAAFFEEEALGDSVHVAKVVSKNNESGVHTVELSSIAQKLVDAGFGRRSKPNGPTAPATAPGGIFQRAVVDIGVAGASSQRETSKKSPTSDRLSVGGLVENVGDLTAVSTRVVSEVTGFSALDVAVGTRQHSVVVSWVVSLSEFYIQLVDNCPLIEKLSRDLCQSYQSSRDAGLTAAECTPGRPCVAFYDADGSWYRGRVVSCTSGRVTVFYVDYGNTEVVPISHVRCAQQQFMKSPPTQALRCCLRGVADQSEWAENEVRSFDAAVSVSGLQCRFVECRGDGVHVVELSDQSGRDLTAAQLRTTSKSDVVVGGKAALSSQMVMKRSYVHEIGLKENDCVQLEVVYVAEGSKVFNCHIIGQTDELDELMADLATSCENLAALTCPPTVGEPCAALYSDDGGWYRAVVEHSTPAEHGVVVKFVDYGNIESCGVSSLRGLDARFVGVPVRRVDAELRGMTAKSLDAVVDDLLGLQFTTTVVSVDRRTAVVTVDDLKASETGQSFTSTHEELFATASTLPPASTGSTAPAQCTVPAGSVLSTTPLPTTEPPHEDVDVYITHVNSPSDFYVQTASIEPTLTELADALVEAYDGEASAETGRMLSDQLTVGSVCCAHYSADGAWYRAIVQSISDSDAVSLRFVDYGNCDVTSRVEVRRLADQFRLVPVCAWHCRLSTTQSDSWTASQQEKFMDLTEAGEKAFVCSFVSRSESPYPVLLKDVGDVDVAQLLATTEQRAPVIDRQPPGISYYNFTLHLLLQSVHACKESVLKPCLHHIDIDNAAVRNIVRFIKNLRFR